MLKLKLKLSKLGFHLHPRRHRTYPEAEGEDARSRFLHVIGKDLAVQLPAESPPSISSPRTYDANLGPSRAILVHSHLGFRLFVGYAAQESSNRISFSSPAQPGET